AFRRLLGHRRSIGPLSARSSPRPLTAHTGPATHGGARTRAIFRCVLTTTWLPLSCQYATAGGWGGRAALRPRRIPTPCEGEGSRPNLTGQPSPTERVFVAILTLTDGTEAESLPFPDRDTADRVGRGSLLDAEVADYRVEERPDPPTCPDCGGLLW